MKKYELANIVLRALKMHYKAQYEMKDIVALTKNEITRMQAIIGVTELIRASYMKKNKKLYVFSRKILTVGCVKNDRFRKGIDRGKKKDIGND